MMTEDKLRARAGALAGEVPGVALVIVGPEGIRARASSGYAELSSRTPMSTELTAPWFSMTKIATATLALHLAQAGMLELDEPIGQLVPQVGLLRPSKWAEQITPRHLLQHSAGLRNPLPVKWVHPAAEPAPEPDRFLQALLTNNGKLRTEPGARTSYSNLGALILAAAMTARSDESFESLMQTNILDPLGMLTTGFGEVRRADNATGYHPRRNPLRYLLPGWVVGETSGKWLALKPFAVDGPPYGGLVGTADDAARFLQMHLADGSFGGEQILRPEVATEMRRITMKGKHYDLGLGWFKPARQRNSTPDFVEHLGGGAGFFNCMRIYPTERVGVIVIGNATKYEIDAVAELALDFRS
jgi:CubicO group peptidase (beta-lactamase class C family)